MINSKEFRNLLKGMLNDSVANVFIANADIALLYASDSSF
jgi:hypothetical protein